MKPDLLLLIKACQAGLHISKPITIKIKTKAKKDTRGLAGYCDSYFRKDRIVGHKVVINLDTLFESEYSIYDTIAHELIHACMLEKNLFDPNHHHDTTFQELAAHLKQYLNNMGFEITCLYDPVTDTD
jgi:predicted SprT family Zn-dependent metalloprotease